MMDMDFNKLAFTVDDKTEYLPTWCIEWTDEEIEDAKRIMIEHWHDEDTDKDEEPQIDWDNLIDELIAQNYTYDEIEMIVSDVACGRTLDYALYKIK